MSCCSPLSLFWLSTFGGSGLHCPVDGVGSSPVRSAAGRGRGGGECFVFVPSVYP